MATIMDLLTGKEEPKKEEEVKKRDFEEVMETPSMTFILYFDGAFSQSWWKGARGIVIINPKGDEEWTKSPRFLNLITNNVA